MAHSEQEPHHEAGEGLPKDISIIRSLDEARELGVSSSDLRALVTQVSEAISEYETDHNAEMQPKSPQDILNQLTASEACLIYHRDANHQAEFLYHGALYPVFEAHEERLTQVQIIEFGADITNRNYRGRGLGTLGLSVRLKMLSDFARANQGNFQTLGISTVKRLVTGFVYGKQDVAPISYWTHPYLAYLTDTCKAVSERYGHNSCKYRRSPEDSSPAALGQLFQAIGSNAYIPCTLLATDAKLAHQFDSRMRAMHQQLLGTQIEPGNISVPAYQAIGQFFQYLEQQAGSQTMRT